jgi:D-aminoacyl-tRNA deacylase
MRVVVQRVEDAHVTLGSSKIAEIGPGLVLYVGIGRGEQDLHRSVSRILGLRLFDGHTKNVVEAAREVLVLSQFTLFARLKNAKPDFHLAEGHERAREMFFRTVDLFSELYDRSKIKKGVFGAYVQVSTRSRSGETLFLDG